VAIFKDDATGHELRHLLGRAVERRVRVRVLADAFGSFWTRSRFWRDMERRGVEVRLFHRSSPASGTSPSAIIARSWS